MRRIKGFIIGLFALASVGCATSVPHGLELAHKGLAVVDIASDGIVAGHATAADVVMRACQESKDVDLCLDKAGMSEDDVAKFEAAMKDVAAAYDAAASALAVIERAWPVIQAQTQAAKAVADGLAK